MSAVNKVKELEKKISIEAFLETDSTSLFLSFVDDDNETRIFKVDDTSEPRVFVRKIADLIEEKKLGVRHAITMIEEVFSIMALSPNSLFYKTVGEFNEHIS